MAHSSRYKLGFKRRKEGKTDYKARLKLVGQNKYRFVVRFSNKHIIAQVVTTKTEEMKPWWQLTPRNLRS